MKLDRNYKVRIHNGPFGDKVYLINAENHYVAYQRFCGIMLNNGYYHSRAIWRSLRGKTLTIAQIRKYGPKRRPQKITRTYFFYPEDCNTIFGIAKRKIHEAAIEITKLK
jgi:hypothetical protein